MARSVTWNGITKFRPGGITRINANALAQIGLSSNGLLGLIGEADGGEPDTIVTIDDPALAEETYRSGPLADAIRLAFDPSSDPRVPAGAFRCYCVKTNQGTQATLTLYQTVATDVATGVPTTVNVPVTVASMTADEYVGNQMRVTFAAGLVETRPITANATGDLTTTTAFTVAPVAADTVEILAPQMTITTRDYGLHTNQALFEWESGVSAGSHWTTTLDGESQLSGDIAGRSYLDVSYIGNSSQLEYAAGTAASAGPGSTTTLEDTGAAFPIAGDGVDRMFVWADDSDNLPTPELRKIASNTATILTVTNAFSVNPWAAAGTVYSVRTGMILDFGVGRPDSAAIASATANTIVLGADLHLATDELADMILVVSGGTGAGQRRSILSNGAGLSATITVDENWTTNPDATSTFQIRYVEAADCTVVGAAGVASEFNSRVQSNQATTPAADLNITITATMTLTDLALTIDADVNYSASVSSGRNGLLLASTLDFNEVDAQDLSTLSGGATQVDIRNDVDAVITAPTYTADPIAQWPGHFTRDLADIVDSINNTSELLTAAKSTGTGTGSGSGRPEFQSGSAGTAGETTGEYLSDGTRGISDNTNWQTAFDALARIRCTHIVPLISEDLTNQGHSSTATFASVAAQLASHVATARGSGQSERGGFLGMKGTFTELITQANSLGDTDIQIVSQQPEVLNVASNVTVMDEWALAVIAAGMRAGVPEVGEPLTWKFFRTSSLTQDSSWDPLEDTDANRLIENGILFAEVIEGKGTRWVRDLTSYIQDDNLAYSEGSVRDAVRYVAYGLRKILEDRFTGKKASPANTVSMKDTAAEYLELQRTENIIVDSTDEDGNFVKAFHNLRVTISGDTATIRVGIFPVVGINFQLNDIYLQLPSQAA